MMKPRNIYQTEKQDNPSEKKIKETEIRNLPDKKLKIMVLKYVPCTWEKMEDCSGNLNREIKNYQKNQLELLNRITEMKPTLDGTNYRSDDAKE